MKFFCTLFFLTTNILNFNIQAHDHSSLTDGFRGGDAKRTFDTVMSAMEKHGADDSAHWNAYTHLNFDISVFQEKTRNTFLEYLELDLNSLEERNQHIQTIINHGRKSEWKTVQAELKKLDVPAQQKQFIIYELLHQTLPEKRWDKPACCAQIIGIVANGLSTVSCLATPCIMKTQCGGTTLGCPCVATSINPYCCLGATCLLYTVPKLAAIYPMIRHLRDKNQLPNAADISALIEYAHSLNDDTLILQPEVQAPPQL